MLLRVVGDAEQSLRSVLHSGDGSRDTHERERERERESEREKESERESERGKHTRLYDVCSNVTELLGEVLQKFYSDNTGKQLRSSLKLTESLGHLELSHTLDSHQVLVRSTVK